MTHIIDPLRTARRAVYVSGSARSATTWLAQLLVEGLGARFLFEPLHHKSAVAHLPHFCTDPAEQPALCDAIGAALTGRLRDPRVDLFQKRSGVFTRRVVKDIRPGLLPVVRAVAPATPIVFIIRHPLQVAVSKHELDQQDDDWWNAEAAVDELRFLAEQHPGQLGELARTAMASIEGDPSPLAPLVATWCVENAVALEVIGRGGAVGVRHEDLVRDLAGAFEPVRQLTGARPPDPARAAQPSKTSWRGEGAIADFAAWRTAIDPATADRLLAITARFGLDDLYAADVDDPVPALRAPIHERTTATR